MATTPTTPTNPTTPTTPGTGTGSGSPAGSPATSPGTTASPPVGITAVANGSNHGTKVDLQATYQALIGGLQAFYQPTDTFQLGGTSYTRDQLIDLFQQFVSIAETTKSMQQDWRGAVQAERNFELQVKPLRAGVRGIVAARFGKDGTQLLKFGFTQGKTGKKTVATKAAAVTKSKATRAARGTKGKKQKLAIKAPATATTAPAAAPAQAASAPAATSGANGVTAAAPAGGSAPQPTHS